MPVACHSSVLHVLRSCQTFLFFAGMHCLCFFSGQGLNDVSLIIFYLLRFLQTSFSSTGCRLLADVDRYFSNVRDANHNCTSFRKCLTHINVMSALTKLLIPIYLAEYVPFIMIHEHSQINSTKTFKYDGSIPKLTQYQPQRVFF